MMNLINQNGKKEAFVYVCFLLVCMYTTQAIKEVKYPETGVTGDCELPHVNAENQAQVLRKSSKGF